jgi:hypothetical protein
MGPAVTYTVPANKYSASTLLAANQLAQNDVNANGQNYANVNGQCIPVFARIVGVANPGEGSWVDLYFYADAACTTPLALPSSIRVSITWTKYNYDFTTYSFISTYTVPQGATYYNSIGHRKFYPVLPPPIIYGDWVASVVLQTDNPNFTAEPNSGVFLFGY